MLDHLDEFLPASKTPAIIAFPLQDAPESLHWPIVYAVGHTGHKLICCGGNSKVNIIQLQKIYLEQLFWLRVLRLEERLGVDFKPKTISAADRMNVDLLYLLLVKGVPIRTNLSDFTVTMPCEAMNQGIEDDLAPNKQFALRLDKTREGELFGCSYSVNTREYIFNAVVDTIEYNEMSQIYVIKCRGSEVEPAYRVEVEENPLEDEQSFDMNERFEKLRTAKCFDEAMTEICENSAMPQDRT